MTLETRTPDFFRSPVINKFHSASIFSLSFPLQRVAFFSTLLPSLVLLHHPQPPAAITQSLGGSRLLPTSGCSFSQPCTSQPTMRAPPAATGKPPGEAACARAAAWSVRPSSVRTLPVSSSYSTPTSNHHRNACLPAGRVAPPRDRSRRQAVALGRRLREKPGGRSLGDLAPGGSQNIYMAR